MIVCWECGFIVSPYLSAGCDRQVQHKLTLLSCSIKDEQFPETDARCFTHLEW